MEDKKKQEQLSEELKELVVARLEVLSPDKLISFGGKDGGLTRDQLIEHVKEGDEIGRKIVDVEMTFLRALKDGVMLEQVLEDLHASA
ncbi:MAG: hypothetical protein ACRD1X_20370 [Vicinamibacteria bacterium]